MHRRRKNEARFVAAEVPLVPCSLERIPFALNMHVIPLLRPRSIDSCHQPRKGMENWSCTVPNKADKYSVLGAVPEDTNSHGILADCARPKSIRLGRSFAEIALAKLTGWILLQRWISVR